MGRTHDGEVAPVHRGDVGDAQPFSRGHNGGVYGAESQVLISGDQLGDAQPVRCGDWLDGERTFGEIAAAKAISRARAIVPS